MAALLDFWQKAQSQPFVWGQNDCALWTASYVAAVTGVDPAASLRGTYSTELQCAKLVKARGGLEQLCSELMADFATGDDVGGCEYGRTQICGIRTGRRLALKGQRGLIIVPFEGFVTGWAVRGE